LSGFDFFSVPFFDNLTERDKIFDIHFVQLLFNDTFFTVRNGHVPVILMVVHRVHQVRSGQLVIFSVSKPSPKLLKFTRSNKYDFQL